MSRILTPDQTELREKVRAFAREVVGPRRLEAYENPPFLMEMNRLMGKKGIFRTVAPKAVGGAEMGAMGGVLVVEELARECPAVAIGAMMQMLFPLNMLKNPVVTERWFQGAVSGEINVAVASSDPVGLANYTEQPEIAKRDGDDYVVNAVRYFSTQGIFADVVGVAACRREGKARHRLRRGRRRGTVREQHAHVLDRHRSERGQGHPDAEDGRGSTVGLLRADRRAGAR